MDWIDVYEKLPEAGSYLVRFTIIILGNDTPFKKKVLYAEAFFNPSNGWNIENRFVYHHSYSQNNGIVGPEMNVTHWMPLPQAPKD